MRQVSQQHLRGFLPLDLASVNVRLQVDHRLARALGLRGATDQRPGCDDVRHGPSLRAGCDGAQPEIGCYGLQ